MKTGVKQQETYESIIQNLLILKKEAIEANPKEAEAVDAILHSLSALRDHLCEPDVQPDMVYPNSEIAEAVLV